MELKVRLSENENNHIVKNVNEYWQIPLNTFINMFLPQYTKNKDPIIYKLVNETEPAHICIVGIQHENKDLLRDNEINILFCIENLAVGRKHYKHFNKYYNCNNKKIDIFIYNHFSEVMYNIKTKEKVVEIIPTINCRVNYYNFIKDSFLINDVLKTSFTNKKFCLFISQNTLNDNKLSALRLLNKYKSLDLISNIPNIKDKTCYNSEELLKIFNEYKFVICFENSHSPGYITEKIFNVFLAKTIPIYDGAQNINDFINKKSYINFDKNVIDKIKLLDNNEELYNRIINEPKINPNSNTTIPDYIDYYLKEKCNYKY